MSNEEFRKKALGQSRFHLFSNYFFCSVLFIIGMLLFVDVLGLVLNGSSPVLLFVVMVMWAPSLYGFWRIPRDRSIDEFGVTLSVEEAMEVFGSFCEKNKLRIIEREGQFVRSRENGIVDIEICVLFQPGRIVSNVKLVQENRSGWLDFGKVEFLRRRFRLAWT